MEKGGDWMASGEENNQEVFSGLRSAASIFSFWEGGGVGGGFGKGGGPESPDLRMNALSHEPIPLPSKHPPPPFPQIKSLQWLSPSLFHFNEFWSCFDLMLESPLLPRPSSLPTESGWGWGFLFLLLLHMKWFSPAIADAAIM